VAEVLPDKLEQRAVLLPGRQQLDTLGNHSRPGQDGQVVEELGDATLTQALQQVLNITALRVQRLCDERESVCVCGGGGSRCQGLVTEQRRRTSLEKRNCFLEHMLPATSRPSRTQKSKNSAHPTPQPALCRLT
jgi:hypothetical protein